MAAAVTTSTAMLDLYTQLASESEKVVRVIRANQNNLSGSLQEDVAHQVDVLSRILRESQEAIDGITKFEAVYKVARGMTQRSPEQTRIIQRAAQVKAQLTRVISTAEATMQTVEPRTCGAKTRKYWNKFTANIKPLAIGAAIPSALVYLSTLGAGSTIKLCLNGACAQVPALIYQAVEKLNATVAAAPAAAAAATAQPQGWIFW